MLFRSYDYEMLRKQYVEERRINKNHKFYKPLWNGVSPAMWEDKEWYDYLHAHGMKDPYGKDEVADLSEFM